MIEKDPVIVDSPLSQKVTLDGVTVDVSIIRLEHESEWSLEVINGANTSIVWNDLFPTDKAAYAEFERTAAEEGMNAFIESAKIIPFPRR